MFLLKIINPVNVRVIVIMVLSRKVGFKLNGQPFGDKGSS